MVRNWIGYELDEARMPVLQGVAEAEELGRLRVDLEREHVLRVQAEARAAAAEERAGAAEEQLRVAKWMVTVLRGELTGDEPSPPLEQARRWRWPWRRQ